MKLGITGLRVGRIIKPLDQRVLMQLIGQRLVKSNYAWRRKEAEAAGAALCLYGFSERAGMLVGLRDERKIHQPNVKLIEFDPEIGTETQRLVVEVEGLSFRQSDTDLSKTDRARIIEARLSGSNALRHKDRSAALNWASWLEILAARQAAEVRVELII